jgi:hypothetical protein
MGFNFPECSAPKYLGTGAVEGGWDKFGFYEGRARHVGDGGIYRYSFPEHVNSTRACFVENRTMWRNHL